MELKMDEPRMSSRHRLNHSMDNNLLPSTMPPKGPRSVPKGPRSAYQLYIHVRKITSQHPSLKVKCDGNRDVYLNYVEAILHTNIDELPRGKKNKFMGSNDFTSMSKMLGEDWRNTDMMTKSVFAELARKDSERYKKELHESYQAFNKIHLSPSRLEQQESPPQKVGVQGSELFDPYYPSLINNQSPIKSQYKEDPGRYSSLTEPPGRIELQCHGITPSTSSHYQNSSSDEALARNSDNMSTPASAYKVTPVDMADDEINALAILMWDIRPSRLIASGNKDVVFSAQDILDFLCSSSNLWA